MSAPHNFYSWSLVLLLSQTQRSAEYFMQTICSTLAKIDILDVHFKHLDNSFSTCLQGLTCNLLYNI